MADNYKGLSKEDHEKLTEAATLYRTLLGKDLTGVVKGIPVAEDTKDAEAEAKKAKERLEEQAEITRKREDADRELRQLKLKQERGSGDNVQPENPGPGQPAMITERAKAQGKSRAGEEPDIAKRGR